MSRPKRRSSTPPTRPSATRSPVARSSISRAIAVTSTRFSYLNPNITQAGHGRILQVPGCAKLRRQLLAGWADARTAASFGEPTEQPAVFGSGRRHQRSVERFQCGIRRASRTSASLPSVEERAITDRLSTTTRTRRWPLGRCRTSGKADFAPTRFKVSTPIRISTSTTLVDRSVVRSRPEEDLVLRRVREKLDGSAPSAGRIPDTLPHPSLVDWRFLLAERYLEALCARRRDAIHRRRLRTTRWEEPAGNSLPSRRDC